MNSSKSSDLIGHWPLLGNTKNAAADALHASPQGNLTFVADGAIFDGRDAKLVIADATSCFGRGDFTLSARIWIDAGEAESIGDIAGKFDPATRTGFNWSVADHGGVTSASSNYRNLNFSFDAGTTPKWSDCGRPGNARLICALTAHRGELYAATSEFGDTEIGRVFRYAGNQQWEDTHVPCTANTVFGLASIDGVLYAASGRYDPRNSSLPLVGNLNEQTRIWRLEPGGTWRDCGNPCPTSNDLYNLAIYRGRLYGAPSYSRGLHRLEVDGSWTQCAEGYPRFLSLCQWRGHLYGASNKGLRHQGPPPERKITFTLLPDSDGVYRYDDRADSWTACGKIPNEDQMYSFAVHRGALYTGTWPNCKVFRSAGGIGWEDCGQFHPDEKEVMGMCIYNGMMYAGTLPAADVYRYDGDHHWTNVGNVDQTQGVKYRRAWSMAVHDGRLFVGSLPAGNVYAMNVGAVASDSHQLTTGWHRAAAVRQGNMAKLYINGQLRGQATASAANLDLTNRVPLTIGLGAHDHFRGKMADLRLHNRALTEGEIHSL
jgi:hypothetical protein